MIRILLVDDHPVVRDGVAATLAAADDLDVVGQASNGPAAVIAISRLDVDVVVMDLRMPAGGGVAAIREITRPRKHPAVLVLTTYDTDTEVFDALEAGATGYLLKDAPTQTLLDAVRATATGETVLSPAVASRLTEHVRAPGARAPLSAREREVLALVADGASSRTIAGELFISEATVKTHLTRLYDKLGVSDRAAAVATAYRTGILG